VFFRALANISDVMPTSITPIVCHVGFGYDRSPTASSSERSVVLPLGATFRYSVGVQYDWNKDFSLGAAYTMIDAGTAKVNSTGGGLKGDMG
jgi:long-subunit fatty acid transport protein